MVAKQKSEPFFDEATADKEIINSLFRHISKLEGDHKMSEIIKAVTGELYMLHNYEELGVKRAEELLEKLEADITIVKEFITEAKKAAPEIKNDVATAEGVVKTAEQLAAEAAPAAPAAPAPAAPATPATPPADPAPAADPATPPAAPATPPAAPSDQPADPAAIQLQ